jgi:outer membrane protein TolC
MRSARVALDMAREEKRLFQMDVLAAVAEAYYAAVLARENLRVRQKPFH